jgi:hypothetical protein
MQARLRSLTLNPSPKGEGLENPGSHRVLYDSPSEAVGRGGVGGEGIRWTPNDQVFLKLAIRVVITKIVNLWFQVSYKIYILAQ